jgi:antiviral helicase SKI2
MGASRYKDAKEALRRKQDKEREAAGLGPVQRLGARAAAPQRGTQRGGQRGAVPARGRAAAPVSGGGGGRFHQADKNVYVHLLGHLKKKSLLPVVVFTFSKKRCEEYAGTLMNSDLSGASEKSEVHVTVERALSRLKGISILCSYLIISGYLMLATGSDKKLPQIARMRDLLSRGIGVHHGGLLPIVKEVVELLFARGLVKVLFATETFAMVGYLPMRSCSSLMH